MDTTAAGTNYMSLTFPACELASLALTVKHAFSNSTPADH